MPSLYTVICQLNIDGKPDPCVVRVSHSRMNKKNTPNENEPRFDPKPTSLSPVRSTAPAPWFQNLKLSLQYYQVLCKRGTNQGP